MHATPKHCLVNISLLEVGCFDTSPLGSPVSKLVEILWQREREPKNQINRMETKNLLSTPPKRRLSVAGVLSQRKLGTKSLHRVIFAEGHLGATAQDGFPAVLMDRRSACFTSSRRRTAGPLWPQTSSSSRSTRRMVRRPSVAASSWRNRSLYQVGIW